MSIDPLTLSIVALCVSVLSAAFTVFVLVDGSRRRRARNASIKIQPMAVADRDEFAAQMAQARRINDLGRDAR